MIYKQYIFARWQHWKTQVKDGADRNDVSYTELEQSYKWARNEGEREIEMIYNFTITKSGTVYIH